MDLRASSKPPSRSAIIVVMSHKICILGAGLAGSEAALQLARLGEQVVLVEARPSNMGPVHKTDHCAELVCSNSLKSEKPASAAGMLKQELRELGSFLYQSALETRVPAGGALAVDRMLFAVSITDAIEASSLISFERAEAVEITPDAHVLLGDGRRLGPFDAFIVATGPLTSDLFASWLERVTGSEHLSFYDAAAPIVYAESLDMKRLFSQSRYEGGEGDYLNAPFSKDEYDCFIDELLQADRVVAKEFEQTDLFQACQPIEEVARAGHDAPRFGTMKPVGLIDPATGKRPWAALQLRAEDAHAQSYNLVGFQTNLTFSEQERVFRMIPGLENAEFARFGVMHRNTFLDAPRMMDRTQRMRLPAEACFVPVFLAGQISGTEGYCEAIRSGLQAAIEVYAHANSVTLPRPPLDTVYGALLAYATSPDTQHYQPMHVNFGIMEPLNPPVKNKGQRREAMAQRGGKALSEYVERLASEGVIA